MSRDPDIHGLHMQSQAEREIRKEKADRQMSETITCTCGQNDWQWVLGEKSTSWICCQNCGDSMFSPDIGVILINWKTTDADFNLGDVLIANQYDDGVIGVDDK